MATHAIQIGFLLAGLRDPDTNEPLNGGSVEFYSAGTSAIKNVWTEPEKVNSYTTYTLDTNGVAQLYGDGIYKIIVKDSLGATEYTFDDVKLTASDYNVRTLTAGTYDVTPDDDILLCDTGAGSITLNVETVVNFTRPLTIKKISASNLVVFNPYGTQKVDGAITASLSANNQTFTLIPDVNATTWRKSNDTATSLVDLTATVAELNILDGATLSTAELNVLDGNTSTAVELSQLHSQGAVAADFARLHASSDEIAELDGQGAVAADFAKLHAVVASAAEIDAAADGIGVTIPRQIVVQIGDWDMDTVSGKGVAFPAGIVLTDIVGLRAIIRNDDDSQRYVAGGNSSATGYGVSISGATSQINLDREGSGAFDNTSFNATSYNRGWVIVDYLD